MIEAAQSKDEGGQPLVAQRESRPASYESIHASDDFQELRKRYRAFVLRWTTAFLCWYLLYVGMSNWAPTFMSTKVFGHINVALIFGLLQFVSTFGIAWLYAHHAAKQFDPLARRLERSYNKEESGHE